MFRPLYNWVLRLAATPYALPALALLAFVEATFPMPPPEVMLGPMVLARRQRGFVYAGVCTAGSVLGGCAGYALGYFLSPAAMKILALAGHAGGLDAFHKWYAQWGVWVILGKGLTPIPYMVVTLASGLAHFSFPIFVAASVATRGGRFLLGATLLQHPHAQAFVDKHLTAIVVVAAVALVAALIVVRHLG